MRWSNWPMRRTSRPCSTYFSLYACSDFSLVFPPQVWETVTMMKPLKFRIDGDVDVSLEADILTLASDDGEVHINADAIPDLLTAIAALTEAK